MPKKPIVKEFREDVYQAHVLLVAGCDADELDRVVSRKAKGPVMMDAQSFVGAVGTVDYTEKKQQKRLYVIWVEDRKDFITLVHECAHIVGRIFADRGVVHDQKHNDAFAYYLEYWVRKLWKVLNA